MSRLTVSNHQSFVNCLQHARRINRSLGQRFAIPISATPEWLQSFSSLHSIPFLSADPALVAIDRSDQITAILGTENNFIIYSAGQEFDLTLFAAAAGTVRLGGMILLCLDRCEEEPASVFDTAVSACTKGVVSGNSLRRLLDLIPTQACESYLTFSSIAVAGSAAMPTPNQRASGALNRGLENKGLESEDPSNTQICAPVSARANNPDSKHQSPDTNRTYEALTEQNHALEQITSHLSNNTISCTLIQGARGRGKSSLLAKLSNWLHEQGIDYAVCVNHPSALHSFNRHTSTADVPVVSHQQYRSLTCTVLLVDEASNWPLLELDRCYEHFKHIVFCATTDGYETAGRSFSIRFAKALQSRQKALLTITLHAAWRWQSGDQLETLTQRLLLQNCEQYDDFIRDRLAMSSATAANAKCRLLPAHCLADDERLLYQIYELLSSSHYQNSVKDLQHLLDSQSLKIWILESDGLVVGVSLLEIEGCIAESLHEAIMKKLRRPKNQLLPQLLALQADDSSLLAGNYARVVRIAVRPELRRLGLGSKLINHIETHYRKNQSGVSAIGASFSNDLENMAFWMSNEYTPFHFGRKLNPRTGRTSAAVIKTWDEDIGRAVSYLNARIVKQDR